MKTFKFYLLESKNKYFEMFGLFYKLDKNNYRGLFETIENEIDWARINLKRQIVLFGI